MKIKKKQMHDTTNSTKNILTTTIIYVLETNVNIKFVFGIIVTLLYISTWDSKLQINLTSIGISYTLYIKMFVQTLLTIVINFENFLDQK